MKPGKGSNLNPSLQPDKTQLGIASKFPQESHHPALDDAPGDDLGPSVNSFDVFGSYINDDDWNNLLDDPASYVVSGSSLNAFTGSVSTFLSLTAAVTPSDSSILPRHEAPHAFHNPTPYPSELAIGPAPYPRQSANHLSPYPI